MEIYLGDEKRMQKFLSMIDDEAILFILFEDSNIIKYMDPKRIKRDMAKLAMEINANVFYHLPEEIRSSELLLEAMNYDTDSERYLPIGDSQLSIFKKYLNDDIWEFIFRYQFHNFAPHIYGDDTISDAFIIKHKDVIDKYIKDCMKSDNPTRITSLLNRFNRIDQV